MHTREVDSRVHAYSSKLQEQVARCREFAKRSGDPQIAVLWAGFREDIEIIEAKVSKGWRQARGRELGFFCQFCQKGLTRDECEQLAAVEDRKGRATGIWLFERILEKMEKSHPNFFA
ncbi:MAG: hypothetical protein Q9166_003996 [cf. Caloplaca sp. 2 TL-2023]